MAPNIQPRALSITQGRAVGVAHYLLGLVFESDIYICVLFITLIIRYTLSLG